MKTNELNAILEAHKKWLNNYYDGIKANLYGDNLREANLREADLREADLRKANLREANLYGANLYGANLREANLRGANLREANLYGANLREANLRGANLYGANLREADLYGANLSGADIDYLSWPLWYGSLRAYADDRIAIQLLYHTLSVVQHSPYVSDKIKRILLDDANIAIANRFHRINECGKLNTYRQIG